MPLIPFVTEELWQVIREEMNLPDSALCSSRRPASEALWIDDAVEREIALVQDAVEAVRNMRGEIGLEPSQPLDIRITSPSAEKVRLLRECQHHFHQLVKVGSLEIGEVAGEHGHAATSVLADVTVQVLLSDEVLHREIGRLDKAIAQTWANAERLEKKLSNAEFSARAPGEVVAAERARLATAKAELEALVEKRSRLG